MPRRDGHDGLPIAVEGTADPHPHILYVHANGFCKELWRPVARSVAERRPGSWWLSMDLRGHGASGRVEPPCHWHPLALDILSVVGDAQGAVGVGHSMGGASLARAEILRSGTFDRLILIEPILFPPPHGRADVPLADVAQVRRSVFPDRDATHRRFASTGPFAVWDPEVLDLYADHGWGPGDTGWTIRCAPAIEADYYREGNNLDTWDRLDEIGIPITLVAGETSDTHRGTYLEALHGRFRHAELVVLDGLGHLAPMESPERVATLIVDAIAAE